MSIGQSGRLWRRLCGWPSRRLDMSRQFWRREESPKATQYEIKKCGICDRKAIYVWSGKGYCFGHKGAAIEAVRVSNGKRAVPYLIDDLRLYSPAMIDYIRFKEHQEAVKFYMRLKRRSYHV
jgi:hypothetical protein